MRRLAFLGVVAVALAWDCISTGSLEQEVVRLVRANVARR